MQSLAIIENELKKCVKCGACRAHCPVFSVLGREPVTARGKVALARGILSGAVPADARTRKDMSQCLLCGRCVEKCANEVPTDLIVLAAREVLAGRRGLTPLSRLIGILLGSRRLMNGGALLASLASPFLFRKVPASSGLRLRFPLPFLGGRLLPAIARKPFLERYDEVMPGEPGRPKIAYFVGCMTNYVYPGIGEAAVSLLRGLGCTVVIPGGQQCCGFPAISGGDLETFRTLAEKNLEALEKCRPDYVMTACASCGGAFHRLYPRLLGERFPELAPRLDALAGKAIDAAVLLKKLGLVPPAGDDSGARRVYYHDPCHLRNRAVVNEPRELLRSLPGVELAAQDRPGSCCGLGGTFNLYHYGTSMGINRAGTARIRESGADVVATGCPGCMMQIADGLNRERCQTRVRHLLEILAEGSRKQGAFYVK